jgi:hypothetical protein
VPLTWSLLSGNLPNGLALTPNGLITGTPTVAGSFNFIVQVTGGTPPQTATSPFQIDIGGALTITTPSALTAGTAFVPYTASLQASGGVSPYTWSLTSGSLPAGLSISPSGALSGTPSQTGQFSFAVRVTDSAGGSATQSFALLINQGSLRITTQTLLTGIQNFAYSQQLQATGGPTPHAWAVVSGSLLPGLALTPAGLLQGVPTSQGSSTIQLRVTDSTGANDTRSFTLTIGPGIGTLSLAGIQSTANPAQQLPLALSLSAPVPAAISGTLTIAFASTATAPADDPSVQFSTGGRSVNFTIPANSSSAVLPSQLMLLTGTVAGTITITGSIQNGPSNMSVASVGVRSLAPQITAITATRVTDGLRVQVTGYSPERRVTNVQFGFDVRTASGTERVNLSRTVEPEFNTWYRSSASVPFGSTFLFDQTFGVQGDASAIDAVTTTLTNGQGSTTSSRVAFPR